MQLFTRSGKFRFRQIVVTAFICCCVIPASQAQYLSKSDVDELPSCPPDLRIPYGSDSLQFGDLRLPAGAEPYPVAVIIHGGCWLSEIADLQHTAALSDALRNLGVATWNIEYRRVDNPGGGWPGTFQDVSSAVDHLAVLAKEHPLDLKRSIIIGHSSGGQLALWAAARHMLPDDSDISSDRPFLVKGVVALAAPTDLQSLIGLDMQICGDSVISKLLGGRPDAVPDRYDNVSPVKMVPLGVPQKLIIGEFDFPMLISDLESYADSAQRAGDDAVLEVIDNASHHEVVAPGSAAWTKVRSAVLSLLEVEEK